MFKPRELVSHEALQLDFKRAAQCVDAREIEANQFAASLPMPGKPVADAVESLTALPLTDHHVENLARDFNVSQQAMTIRLSNLGLL